MGGGEKGGRCEPKRYVGLVLTHIGIVEPSEREILQARSMVALLKLKTLPWSGEEMLFPKYKTGMRESTWSNMPRFAASRYPSVDRLKFSPVNEPGPFGLP